MVKDILREIRRKWFQFIAIAAITALGVGFFVGIQVTGYDMRVTGDAYVLDAKIPDLKLIHTLGFDDAMLDDIKTLSGADVSGIYDYDAFIKSGSLDTVFHIVEYDENTKKDLSIVEGRLPESEFEMVVDDQLRVQDRIKLNDEIKIIENDLVEGQTMRVVGFVDSSLYMNLDRGQTRLGSGNVGGFAYAQGSPLKESVFTSLRVIGDDTSFVEEVLKENETKLADERFERLVAQDRADLAQAQIDLDQGKIDADAEFAKQWQTLVRSQNELDDQKNEVSLGISEVASLSFEGSLTEQLQAARVHSESVLEMGIEELNAQRLLAQAIEDEMIKQATLAQIDQGLAEIEVNRGLINQAYDALDEAILLINDGEVQLANGRSAYANAQQELKQEFADAQKKIDDGLQTIEDASHGSLFILNRSESIIGYDDFYQDSERIEAIGKVFPLIFFGVAILVTLSTVSRMVDESRMQIGVYKALGYSWLRTSMKFVGFTFFAWIIGSSIGLIIGFYMIPNLIYDAYRIMYLTPELVDGFVLSYAVVPLVVSLFSSVGVALFKSQSVARETAALLMVPPLPKGGQRIFLERFGFLWKRLSFLYKVSLRNLFRNKTRFLMTLVGIGGCCGLLLTGFGLKHSIYSIVDKQFDEIINYDGVVAYQKDWATRDDYFVDQVHLHSDNASVGSLDVSVYAAESMDDLGRLVHLKDAQTHEKIVVNDSTVVISQKLASFNNLEVSDTFELMLDNKPYEFVVGAITENYIAHYIYLDQVFYESIIGKNVDSNLSLFQYAGDDEKLSTLLLEDDDVLSVSLLGNLKETYIETMGNFDIVIYVIVGAAFALELIVLLNLITMNMSERSKELATLKVLGFYPKELSSYIMRENILLTLLSLGVGLVFGKYLHQFVVVSAEINMVMFNREILWSSYAWALGLTFGLSVLINVFMARRANNVNMAEALKS